jgi:hypothetical protein
MCQKRRLCPEVIGKMAGTSAKIDVEKATKTAEHVLGLLGGAVVSGMIYLGDRMGLYRAMSSASALTSEELARRTGLNERWVRSAEQFCGQTR